MTAFELLAAIDAASPENFPNVKERIALAYNLCNGRILEDPRFLICTELLHIPAPQITLPSFARMVGKHMDVVRRANSFDELTRTGVRYKGRMSSPTHSVSPEMYYSGWAGQSHGAISYREGWSASTDGNHYGNGHTYYGIKPRVGSGGALFFTHYSFFGFDPHSLHDRFTSLYFENNRNTALINRAYCIANPKHFEGYGPDAWVLLQAMAPRAMCPTRPTGIAIMGP